MFLRLLPRSRDINIRKYALECAYDNPHVVQLWEVMLEAMLVNIMFGLNKYCLLVGLCTPLPAWQLAA